MIGRKPFFLVLWVLLLAAALVSEGAAERIPYTTVDIGGMTYLIEDAARYDAPEVVRRQAESFYRGLEEHPEVRSYVYLVNSSRTVKIPEEVTAVPKVYETIRACFDRSVTDYLRLGSLEEYGAYFYTTDHHWNYRGSYAGYTQIVHMLLGEEEPVLSPAETVEFPIPFNGSLNKNIRRKDSRENFTVYRFEYPPMKVEVNGKPGVYGNQEAYFAGRYARSSYANHYNAFYGGEAATVHVETEREDRGNLLVFSNSMSDALNLLLAGHFHHTWIVDLKHMSETMKRFHLSTAVTEWDIDQVLILGDGLYFGTEYVYE